MTMTDPIADLLTRVRNALTARHDRVEIPASRLKVAIVRILKDEGFIKNFKVSRDNKQGQIRIFLKYSDRNSPVINGLQRVSKPGRRVYQKASELKPVLSGLGVLVVSTSRGVMTDKEARRNNLGGECLCQIW
ncbi:MAG: 30S ribosomal protein S8 [Deltaproteobacteria bacterium]|jgi:small subunit ribosomal protein S8|nr:30S ribosomal protein S8 [Deltaproteobacteria bacterium]MDR1296172.1 30S ribosomal protein S8 [Deltaproteobacteria bacterium]